jgi:hypothetical protein
VNKGQLTMAAASALLFSCLSAPAQFLDEFAGPGIIQPDGPQ